MREYIRVPVVLAMTLCGVLAQQPTQQPPASSSNQAPPERTENAPPEVKPAGPSALVDPRAYIIGAEDILSIRVWREPENSGNFTVRPDGKISIPLVGEIQAAGMTPEKLGASIAEGPAKGDGAPGSHRRRGARQ